MVRFFAAVGAALMFLGVAAGAFGAHGLRAYFAQYPDLESTFATAVRYHLLHGLALLLVSWAAGQWPGALITWSGYLLFGGVVVFSGSLYLLVFTRLSWLGAITPLGGVAFLAGWLLFLLAALRN